jgi:hypothetical protein
VYAAGHDRLTQYGLWMASVLASGNDAVLSHRSAAALWGLFPAATLVEVTVPRTGRTSRGTLLIHRSARLPSADVTKRHGIPVTRPARTLLDLAEVVCRRELERALDEAERLRLGTERLLRSAIERHPGRIGGARLYAALREHPLGSTATANPLEEAFLSVCDGHGIARPEVNVALLRYRVDFLWRAHGLIVETDGHETHGTRTAFERDRARDAELTTAGWRVLRFTWRQVDREPEWVAAKVRQALSRIRTPPPRSRPRRR